MINKINCFFGFHKKTVWSAFHDGTVIDECTNCGKSFKPRFVGVFKANAMCLYYILKRVERKKLP